MKYKLTTQEKLKDLRLEKGLSLEQLADATGISKSALASYESDNEREIGSYNLSTLAKFYGVSSDYLLGLTETKQTFPLSTDSLRISDDAIKVLQNGTYNPLLLSEILTNENFPQLMVDVEIYVDGNVSNQFAIYNKLYESAQAALIRRTHPTDYDLHMEKLKKMSINEDSFFERTLSGHHANLPGNSCHTSYGF
jgi:Predicted transcriptional regulators